jgi:hypothetical protein
LTGCSTDRLVFARLADIVHRVSIGRTLRIASRRACCLGLSVSLACATASAQPDPLAGRPAFSEAEDPAQRPAQCGEIRRMSAGLPEVDYRINLSVIGELTGVRTDGALWYLFMCEDVRVLCVTYASNGMQRGDRVLVRGGYIRRDANHVQLDPCLASRPD